MVMVLTSIFARGAPENKNISRGAPENKNIFAKGTPENKDIVAICDMK